MSDDKSHLTNDFADVFNSESNKLREKIDSALKNSKELSLQEIIEIYHQVINVTSIAKILKEDPNLEQSFRLSIQEKEKHLNEKFDNSLHLKIISQLKNSNEGIKIKLKNITNANKTKTEIENQAKMFEQLRQIMSTQEFVNQYDKTLLE